MSWEDVKIAITPSAEAYSMCTDVVDCCTMKIEAGTLRARFEVRIAGEPLRLALALG